LSVTLSHSKDNFLFLLDLQQHNMTLDVTTFIAEKEGDPESIRESQKKRGNSVELVDEVIALYKEWVKGKQSTNRLMTVLRSDQLISN